MNAHLDEAINLPALLQHLLLPCIGNCSHCGGRFLWLLASTILGVEAVVSLELQNFILGVLEVATALP